MSEHANSNSRTSQGDARIARQREAERSARRFAPGTAIPQDY